MGFWDLVIGEAIVWMAYNGNWMESTPEWWFLGYVGTAIVVGIVSFVDLP